MLTLILLVILAGGFLIGLRRGLVFQIVHLTGLIAAFVVAYLFFDNLAPRLRLWIPYPSGATEGTFSFFSNALSLEDAYYNAIAFAILFFATKILMHIIGSMLDFLMELPLLHMANRWLGGVFGFIEIYLILFLFLYVAAFVPVDYVQHAVSDSILAQAMVQHTPIISEQIKDLWLGGAGQQQNV